MLENLYNKFEIFIKKNIDGNKNYDNEELNDNFYDKKDKNEKHKIVGNFYCYMLLDTLKKDYDSPTKVKLLMSGVKELFNANLAYNNYQTISNFVNDEIFKQKEFKHIYNDITSIFAITLKQYKCNNLLEYLNENSLSFYLKFVNEKHEKNYKYLDDYFHTLNYNIDFKDNNIIYLLENEESHLILSHNFFELYKINNQEVKEKLNNIIEKNPKAIMESFFNHYKESNKTNLTFDVMTQFKIDNPKTLYLLVNSIIDEINYSKLVKIYDDDRFYTNYSSVKEVFALLEEKYNNNELNRNI